MNGRIILVTRIGDKVPRVLIESTPWQLSIEKKDAFGLVYIYIYIFRLVGPMGSIKHATAICGLKIAPKFSEVVTICVP